MKRSYEKVTIRDICKACGISIGDFYHHFKSKLSILDETFRLFDRTMGKKLDTMHFSDSKEELLYIFRSEAVSLFGISPSLFFFSDLMLSEQPYIIDKNCFFYKKLYGVSMQYVTEYGLKADHDRMIDELIRISRGAIYDLCLHRGSYDLTESVMMTIGHVLFFYEYKGS